MLFKGFLRRLLVVLAAHRQKDSSIFQFLQPRLKIREGMSGAQFSGLDAAQAVVPNNAAPKGIVQVNNDTFFHRTPECLHNVYHLLGNAGEHLHGKGHFGYVIKLGIGKLLPALEGLQSIQIHKAHIFNVLTALHQKIVQFSLLKQEGFRCLIPVLSKAAVIHQREITLEDRALGIGIYLLPNPKNPGIGILRKGSSTHQRRGAESFIEFFSTHLNQHSVRPEGIKLRTRIHDLRIDLIVVGIRDGQSQTSIHAVAPNGCCQMLGGTVSHDRQLVLGKL